MDTNIVDFSIICLVFFILSYQSQDDLSTLIIKGIIMFCFVMFYFLKIKTKKENFIKCYTGHEPAKAIDSYNSEGKSWCTFTGVPDTQEIKVTRDFPAAIYNINPYDSFSKDELKSVDYLDRFVRANKKPVIEKNHPDNHVELLAKKDEERPESNYTSPNVRFIDINEKINDKNTDEKYEERYKTSNYEIINKFGVLDRKLYNSSMKSDKRKIYGIKDMGFHIFKPILREKRINDEKEDFIDYDYDKVETFNDYSDDLYKTFIGVNENKHFSGQCIDPNLLKKTTMNNALVKNNTCRVVNEKDYDDKKTHYHDKSTFSTVRKTKNLIPTRYNNNDLSQLLIIFAKDTNEYNSFSEIETFNKHVKKKLLNNVAVVVVNIQSPVEDADSDGVNFYQLYYRAKFIIQHFKYYHTEYGIDPNFIGIKGSGIVGLICYMFAYYGESNLKKLENLMNLPVVTYRKDTRVQLIILEDPLLILDNYVRQHYLNDIKIQNGRLFNQKPSIDQYDNKKIQKDKLALDLNISVDRLEKNKDLIYLFNGVHMFNHNKSYTPLILKSKIMVNNFPLGFGEINDPFPFEAYDVFNMAKKQHVHVLGQLKHFNIGNDKDNYKNEVEFIHKYLQYRGEIYPKKAMHPV